MGIIDNMLDWAADKVQTATGEKERRELVQKIKNTYIEFKEQVENKISVINELINEFNVKIRRINMIRKDEVEKKIILLSDFLGKFGNIKTIGTYAEENEIDMVMLPERQFEKKEQYIEEIDWSKEDVAINTFFLSPIGMSIKTRKQNLAMKEQLNEFRIEVEHTLAQLQMKSDSIGQDKVIADIYIFCIETITGYIQNVILPELEVVEAFFQALKIKDEVIAEQQLKNIQFLTNIELLKDTQYERHYLFVKNTFMFYIIACRIYNTPILTRLLNNNTNENDIYILQENKKMLLEQKKLVDDNLLFKRGE